MSDIPTPERSFIPKESFSTSLLGGKSVSSEAWGDQSSDPAHFPAVTWTVGDRLAQVPL